MSEEPVQAQTEPTFNAVLRPHRSLSPLGFLVLMSLIGLVSFIVGMYFLILGAWPITGFFGLDVALMYWAFKLSYKSGLEYETVELSSERLRLTHYDPRGERHSIELNPYWVRVGLTEEHDGRTIMWLASHGREIIFGRFLSDDEKREFAGALSSALSLNKDVRV